MNRITARNDRCDRALLTQELADEKDEFAIRHVMKVTFGQDIALTLAESREVCDRPFLISSGIKTAPES